LPLLNNFFPSSLYFIFIIIVTMSEVTYHGSCLCESVKLTLHGAPVKAMACHCVDCQKSGGGPFQTNALYNTSDVEIVDTQGYCKKYVVPKEKVGSGVEKQKWFCANCGCTLFTRPMKYNGEKSVVKTGILDAPAGFHGQG
jgi:hypothetical protein